MTARIACAAVGIIGASAIGPGWGFLAAIIGGTWLVLGWRTPPADDPAPAVNHAEAVKALERIATKALSNGRGGRRRKR